MGGSDGNVFDEATASAPPRNTALASTTISLVAGVSFAQTGIVATSDGTIYIGSVGLARSEENLRRAQESAEATAADEPGLAELLEGDVELSPDVDCHRTTVTAPRSPRHGRDRRRADAAGR